MRVRIAGRVCLSRCGCLCFSGGVALACGRGFLGGGLALGFGGFESRGGFGLLAFDFLFRGLVDEVAGVLAERQACGGFAELAVFLGGQSDCDLMDARSVGVVRVLDAFLSHFKPSREWYQEYFRYRLYSWYQEYFRYQECRCFRLLGLGRWHTADAPHAAPRAARSARVRPVPAERRKIGVSGADGLGRGMVGALRHPHHGLWTTDAKCCG